VSWLTDLTNWLSGVLTALFNGLVDLGHDLIIFLVEGTLGLFQAIVSAIPSPDFLTGISICGILGSAGPTAAWIIGVMHIPQGMGMVAAAVVFRLTRKVLTLFQW
jgi:hypothetical protein